MISNLADRLLRGDLVDVARGKPARQSSLSEWSREGEAALAVAEGSPFDFAFHTRRESNPWWEVDLKGAWPVDCVVIHNRLWTMQSRARRLRVEARTSDGGLTLLHSGFSHFGATEGEGDPFVLMLGGEIEVEAIRISLDAEEYLHLSRVEVFARKDVVAARDYFQSHGLQNVLNPGTHTPYTLTAAPDADRSRIVGLKVDYSGRFGNLIHQYVNAVQLAARTGLKFVQLGDHPLLRPRATFEIRGITFLRKDDNLPPDGAFISGEFFNSDDFRPVLSRFLHFTEQDEQAFTAVVQEVVAAEILDPDLGRDVQPDPAELTIHLRSGDVFGPDHPVVRGYRQPPLSFYRLVVADMRARGLSGVCLVYEDEGNPCVGALKRWLDSEGVPFRVQSGSLKNDLKILLNAESLVFGHGTFGYAVSRLSPHIRNLYYFAPELGGCYSAMPHVDRVVRISDRRGGYIKAYEHGRELAPGEGWYNTEEMRELMTTYPEDALEFEEVVTRVSGPATDLRKASAVRGHESA